MSNRSEKTAATAFIAAAFLLFCLYSVTTPLFEASDELWHYPVIQHLVAGNGLPVQHVGQTDANAPWRQEGSQPPLYYAITALITAPFDHSNWRELRRLNIHADMGVPTYDGNANAILHSPAEAWPWTRAALAVRIARLVSILMSTATVAFAYRVVRELWSEERGARGEKRGAMTDTPFALRPSPFALLRLSTIIFTACIPMFAFISGAINNDNAAVMFSTIGLWWALRLMRTGNLSAKSALVAGLITGLGALSKSSALGLLGLFGVAALLTQNVKGKIENEKSAHKQHPLFIIFNSVFLISLTRFILIMSLTTLAISGWWFVRNVNLYGDLLGWNAFLDSVGRRIPPATLSQLWSEREGFVWAFWGVFGTLNVIMPTWVYGALDGMVIVAVLGWLRQASNIIRQRPTPLALRSMLLCVFWVTLVFVALLRWTSLTPASQGRLMFPCIAAIAACMVYGLWRVHRFVLIGASGGLVLLAIAVPLTVIAPTYAQPINQWRVRLPQPLNTQFGDQLTLVEAGSSDTHLQPGQATSLILNWQAFSALPKNYTVFVHLVDQNGVTVGQRDMYPGQGNLALSEIPNNYLWTDHYTVRLSTRLSAPKMLRWRVGVYDAQTGERLKTQDGGEFVTFGQIDLQPRPANSAPLLTYANGAQLRTYTLDPEALTPGTTLSATLEWAHFQIDGDYAISVQVLDEGANKIGSRDVALPKQAISDTLRIDISKDATPGVYRVLLVVYRPSDSAKVGAYDERGQYNGDQIELTKIRVK